MISFRKYIEEGTSTLYALIGIEHHVGEHLIGIFSSKAKAEAYASKTKPVGYDEHEVRAVKVDQVL